MGNCLVQSSKIVINQNGLLIINFTYERDFYFKMGIFNKNYKMNQKLNCCKDIFTRE